MEKLNVDDLIAQGLVKMKSYTEGKYAGLAVLKYTRKVFFKNLWHLDERLLECRGTVVDSEDNVIVLPFQKVFNLHENHTEILGGTPVVLPMKMNGFMASATKTIQYGLIVSTTGTLDSDFAVMARKHIEAKSTDFMERGVTYLFEICDVSDPHIVPEKEGAYLIGARHIKSGTLAREVLLDGMSDYMRPPVVSMYFSEALKVLQQVKHEGFMVRNVFNGDVMCKLKSPYYLSTKALMRVGKARIKVLFDNPEAFKERIDEEFYGIVDHITDIFTEGEWEALTEQGRRAHIEEYYYD
jgi:hypothetical protein